MVTEEKLLFALSSVMLLAAPAAKVVTPVTETPPVCVIAPDVPTFNVPAMLELPKLIALASRRLTFRPAFTNTVAKSLLKLLAVISRTMFMVRLLPFAVTTLLNARLVLAFEVVSVVSAPRDTALL